MGRPKVINIIYFQNNNNIVKHLLGKSLPQLLNNHLGFRLEKHYYGIHLSVIETFHCVRGDVQQSVFSCRDNVPDCRQSYNIRCGLLRF